jgi:hypothetical protein
VAPQYPPDARNYFPQKMSQPSERLSNVAAHLAAPQGTNSKTPKGNFLLSKLEHLNLQMMWLLFLHCALLLPKEGKEGSGKLILNL